MSLHTGTRLGPYDIIAPIGAGGMGEVYRGRDTRLDRNVAIKTLPDVVAQDRDRLLRFEREAKVLASLNHPNIATIYGVEDRALIMELVEGVTLAERIAQGPIPFDEASPIIHQIVDALEYAHENSVVHRDLKPANIKITPGGQVKVLDFGLAKALTSETAVSDPTVSPTLTMRATMAGVVMGTAAYMAPEQARGQNVDKRADIWAFGVVVYEMLTGERLFQGQTVSDTLAAVLKEEPKYGNLPISIRELLRLCLVKDPRRRLRDIGDARLLLELPQLTPAIAAQQSSIRRVLPWAVAFIACVIAVVLGFSLWRANSPVQRPLYSFSIDLGPGSIRGRDTTAAVSPDGARIAFPVRTPEGKQALAVREMSQPNATVLPGTENGINPFFSPDGKWLAYFAERKLKKVLVHGGGSVELCEAGSGRGGSWGPDGYIIAAFSVSSGLFRIPEGGGTPQPLTKPSDHGETTHRWPQILPGGRKVLFTASIVQANFDNANIELLSLDSGKRKTVIRGGYFGRYLRSGHLVYLRQGTMFAMPFDPDRLESTGTPVPVVDGIAASVEFGGGQFDVADNGTLVYLSGTASRPGGWQVLSMDSSGKSRPLLTTPANYLGPRFSPDGKRLVFSIGLGKADIWLYDLQRQVSSKLSFAPLSDHAPVWAPDGAHVVYQSQTTGGWGIKSVRADGSGEPERLWESKSFLVPVSFSPDGRVLAFFETAPETGMDIWTLPLETGGPGSPKPGKAKILLGTRANENFPAFSPDGRWIAYVSDEAGAPEVYVRSLSGGGKSLISAGGGLYPVWSKTRKQLLYASREGRISIADYTIDGNSFRPGKVRPWAAKQTINVNTSPGFGFDLAPDGNSIVFLPAPDRDEQAKGNLHVTVLLNWFDELRRRVPTGKQ
jgi:serine/threonine protein kinase